MCSSRATSACLKVIPARVSRSSASWTCTGSATETSRGLVTALRARLARPGNRFAAEVLLGHVLRAQGHEAQAREAYERAVALRETASAPISGPGRDGPRRLRSPAGPSPLRASPWPRARGDRPPTAPAAGRGTRRGAGRLRWRARTLRSPGPWRKWGVCPNRLCTCTHGPGASRPRCHRIPARRASAAWGQSSIGPGAAGDGPGPTRRRRCRGRHHLTQPGPSTVWTKRWRACRDLRHLARSPPAHRPATRLG